MTQCYASTVSFPGRYYPVMHIDNGWFLAQSTGLCFGRRMQGNGHFACMRKVQCGNRRGLGSAGGGAVRAVTRQRHRATRGVMSAGLGSCLLSVPGPDKNRQAGLGRPVWNCHHGHLLTAIITGTPASHRYSIQTQLGALHVPLQPAITNTPAGLTRLPSSP